MFVLNTVSEDADSAGAFVPGLVSTGLGSGTLHWTLFSSMNYKLGSTALFDSVCLISKAAINRIINNQDYPRTLFIGII